MKLEHFAINVEDPINMAKWYVQHLGLSIIKQQQQAPFMTFLADDSGQIMIEIYKNPIDQVPKYRDMHPLIVHLAFVSETPDRDRTRLEEAGAITVSNDILDDGSHLVMMRDPWGLAIQLCKRATAMLR
ncbi:glyoxalase/bleomycin resistance protein/dioxygenase superfamily protein [Arcticibacter pallidicorallinus]|uniref:Glyoxalase/bleomycin resistance protein/dioxygenase superfamily protein n=1 Tax=Arcticibacter pallidicorallinus TaxID=1259464 RepID=A0A2T0U3U9_9SPHI|nr:VOC family protein [Arcticibacter pallidicorallinus]PRY52592.1 glyoxalase/bleomycin resistance protein/dioxygenase superfamily protein [Arcticibacter pallidicorallinus]